LRFILKVQGVALQVNPLVVVTAAPAGVDSTVQACLVPRVTVAQAAVIAAKATQVVTRKTRFKSIMIAPKV
jgi:hypothetical protein